MRAACAKTKRRMATHNGCSNGSNIRKTSAPPPCFVMAMEMSVNDVGHVYAIEMKASRSSGCTASAGWKGHAMEWQNAVEMRLGKSQRVRRVEAVVLRAQ
eukprot:6570597-Prymnesium_polylepis.1